jgi:hypothetical protein
MSFMDPDLRDEWRKADEVRQRECFKRNGNNHRYEGDACADCGKANPNPRVTLVVDDLRAVYDPTLGSVVIEKLGRDAIGGAVWTAVQTINSTQSKSEPTNAFVFKLLSRGRRPESIPVPTWLPGAGEKG